MCPGQNSKRSSLIVVEMVARRAVRRGTPAATGRRWAGNGNRTHLHPNPIRSHWPDPVRAPCPMPSCTVTATFRSSTGPATPSNSPRRPLVWVSRRSRSLITMGSMGWCASLRRPERWGCQRCSVPRSASRRRTARCAARPRRSIRSTPAWCPMRIPPTLTANIWSCSPKGRTGTPGWRGRSASATWRARRARLASRSTMWPMRWPGTGGCSPGAARVGCQRRWCARGPALQHANCGDWSRRSVATVCWWSCGTTATRWTRCATTPSPNSRHGTTWGASPPTTCTTQRPPSASWPRPWRRYAPGAASTTSTRGCPPHRRRTCAAALSRRDGSCATRAWWRSPQRWVALQRSTCRWWRRSCRPTRAPPGPPIPLVNVAHSTRWPTCGNWPKPAVVGATATGQRRTKICRCARGHGARSITNCKSSTGSGSPATSWWCGTSSSSATAPTSSARVEAAQRTVRSVTRSASPRPMPYHWVCCSNGSSRPNAMGHPTSTSTSKVVAGKR
ncbi:unannotated protein [freshwater metagenome]|uniref:Unannotated protein n=1 Tax=freshwater metagenome TaxID=449393 RepID=A0A6J7J6P0_9ZZZZ